MSTSAQPLPDPSVSTLATGGAEVRRLPSAVPRRLPSVLMPVVGESFPSWVDRVAVDLELTPGETARRLGLEFRSSDRAVRPVCYGVALTELGARRIGAATGLDEIELRSMQLARYAGGVLDFSRLDLADPPSVTRLSNREWALFTGTRACPKCLGERPVWQLWWRLGIAAVCPVHRVLLVDTCPTCGDRLGLAYSGHPGGLPTRSGVLDLRRCNNRRSVASGRRSVPCEQALAELPSVTVPVQLVDVQELVLEAAHGGPVVVAGRAVATADFFAALRYLATAVRAGAEPSDLAGCPALAPEAAEAFTAYQHVRRRARHGGARTKLGMTPPTAAHAAAVLALTAPLLVAPRRTAMSTALARWQRSVPESLTIPACLSDNSSGQPPTGAFHDTAHQEGRT
ncbi:TniQ family protein [Kitasatospora purpeofusca]|uniref:TniQ family protein n=1 Tax=Kitasatospora purpeofusca TaxID=67352 RepID=UPI0035DBB853